ncbi:MAG TPA: hypothetical protein EYG06_12000 [Myxococcales bacterium]|nr:hypothetical protein [Myxococcales bacterium]
MRIRMTNPANDESQPRDRKSMLSFLGPLAVAIPPLALAIATITGLGVVRQIPLGLAALVGLVLTLLPLLGLSRLGFRHPGALAWLWTVLLLVSLPLYFPGERDAAAGAGLRHLSAFLGSGTSREIASAGVALVGLLGDDPRPALARALPPATQKQADPLKLRPEWNPSNADPIEPKADLTEVELPYRGDAHSLRIEVEIDGPDVGEAFTMIFDTGATFTTLNYASLRAIGVSVESDAPHVTLRTANGSIEADLVLVDAIWLGAAPVEWVTVAVCDSCANPPAVGLLGLNVSRRFQVSLDHDRQSIRLGRRQGADNRALDIQNWLRIRSEIREDWNGGVRLKLTGMNDSRREIESAVIDLECSSSGFAIQLDSIPAKGEATTELVLPRGTDCRQPTFDLSRGRWSQDRF